MLPSRQKLGSPSISGLGNATSITSILDAFVHPFTSVTVTEYIPGSEINMDCKLAPVDQAYISKLLDTEILLNASIQSVDSPSISATGNGFTVTSISPDPLHVPCVTNRV